MCVSVYHNMPIYTRSVMIKMVLLSFTDVQKGVEAAQATTT